MKREVQNYIFMGMGFIVILMIICWDLLMNINWLLLKYNGLITLLNTPVDATPRLKVKINFFGTGLYNLNLLKDLTILFIVLIVITMIVLKIYWDIKYKEGE